MDRTQAAQSNPLTPTAPSAIPASEKLPQTREVSGTRRRLKLALRAKDRFQSFVTREAFRRGARMLQRFCDDAPTSCGRKQRPISEDEMTRLADRSRPTVGFTLSHSNTKEMAVTALAAARERAKGRAAPNIVFIPPSCIPSLFTKRAKDREILYLKRGLIVDAEGHWREGRFPKPLPLALVGTFQGGENPLVPVLEALGIPLLNGSVAFKTGRDKTLNKRICEELGIRSPACLILDLEHEPSSWTEQLERFVSRHELSEVVIKPAAGSHGDGVKFAPSTAVEQVPSAIESLLAADKPAVLIEERIKSFPLHTKDGFRQDWNIRLLVGQEGVIDWEARVIDFGKIANKAKGAWIEEVDDVFERAGLSSIQRSELTAQVHNIGLSIARRLKGGYLGIDLIVSEGLLPWVFEINSGAVGGLVSLTEIREGERRFDAPCRFLNCLMAHPVLQAFRPEARGLGEVRPVAPDPWEHPWLSKDLNRWLVRYSKATPRRPDA